MSLLTVASARAASDRVVMPFSCELKDGTLNVKPSAESRSYPIIGTRRERKYTACRDEAGRDCKSMQVYQFSMSCGGARVSWHRIAAEIRSKTVGKSRLEDGRLHLILAATPKPDAEEAGTTKRFARFILPPAYAPIEEIGARLQIGGAVEAAEQSELVNLNIPSAVPVPVPKPAPAPTIAERPAPAQADASPKDAGPIDKAQGWQARVEPRSEGSGTTTQLPKTPTTGYVLFALTWLGLTGVLAGGGWLWWRKPVLVNAAFASALVGLGYGVIQIGKALAAGRRLIGETSTKLIQRARTPATAGPALATADVGNSQPTPAHEHVPPAAQALPPAAGFQSPTAAQHRSAAREPQPEAPAPHVPPPRQQPLAGSTPPQPRAQPVMGAINAGLGKLGRTRASLRERLEKVSQSFSGAPAQPNLAPPRQPQAHPQQPAPPPAQAQPEPAPSAAPPPQRPADTNLANGLKSVESLFAQVAEIVGNVRPESPLRETLEHELRNIAHKISLFVGSGEQAPSGPRAAATLRGAVRDLERVRRIAESAAASLTTPGQGQRPTRLPQTKGEAYEILGVNSDVTEATLKKVVDALRMSWHPDLAKDDADRMEREERIKQINIAWEIINDKRAA